MCRVLQPHPVGLRGMAARTRWAAPGAPGTPSRPHARPQQHPLPLRAIRVTRQVVGELLGNFGAALGGPRDLFGPLRRVVEQLRHSLSRRGVVSSGLGLLLARTAAEQRPGQRQSGGDGIEVCGEAIVPGVPLRPGSPCLPVMAITVAERFVERLVERLVG
jgi:hypothetical protein